MDLLSIFKANTYSMCYHLQRGGAGTGPTRGSGGTAKTLAGDRQIRYTIQRVWV